MAAAKVTITGVLIDLYGRTISGPLKLVGDLVRTDVGIGGGPILPGEGPVDPGYGVPDRPVDPGYGYPEKPVDPGYGIPGPPYPDVPPPEGQPDSDGFIKAPPPGGGWGYHQTYQWLFDPPPGSAQPK